MQDLREMIREYTIKYAHILKRICAPLKDCLGISGFCYFRIDEQGRYLVLGNHTPSLELFFEHKCYLHNPSSVHPHLLRSGYLLIPDTYSPPFLRTLSSYSPLRHLFLMLERYEESVEGFYFGTLKTDNADSRLFLDYGDLLHKFTRHFKREARDLLQRMESEEFNLKKVKGPAFLEGDPLFPLSNRDPRIQKFLKLIFPLSHRERQCLELLKQGHSARSTGAILRLSQRTVEDYFENIKQKLNCYSKADLLLW